MGAVLENAQCFQRGDLLQYRASTGLPMLEGKLAQSVVRQEEVGAAQAGRQGTLSLCFLALSGDGAQGNKHRGI